MFCVREQRNVGIPLLGPGQKVWGWAGAERGGGGHEVLSLVEGVGHAIFSYP